MGTPIAFMTGTTNGFSVGVTKRATVGLNTGTSLVSGNNWWNGVDVSSQYLLYSDQFSQGQSTIPLSRPTAWSTPSITNQNLLNLINTLPDRVGLPLFTDINLALQWLQNSQKYLLIKNGYENIVTDGLVLNLDAGWANSYPGTGTVWTDLTGSGNNVSLVNGPTLSNDGLGSILMDGADDWAGGSGQCPQVLFDNSQSHSFSLWIKKNGANSDNYAYIYDKYGTTRIPGLLFLLNTNTLAIEWWSGYWVFLNTGLEVETGKWNFVNVTINALGAGQTKTVTVYLYKSTGLVQATVSSSADWNAGTNGEFAIGKSISNGAYFNGKIACVLTYNKLLSASEIQQNYDVQKSRFGYWGQTLWSGVTQYYDFTKGQSYPGTGTAITDLSGNGYNGSTVGGSFTTISGVKCWDCTINGYVLTDTDFTYGNNYTILIWAWALADSQVSNWRTLLRTIDDDHPLIIQDGTDLIGYYDNNAAGFVSYGITLASTGLANNWGLYTLVGTNGTSQKLYINDGTTNATVNYNVTGEKQDAWGNAQGGTQEFGYVSSMVVYNNQAFTQEQVTQYFNTTKQYFGYTPNNIPTNGLVMNLDAGNPLSYPGTGTIWYDLTPYGNNVDLINGPTFVPITNGGYFNNDGDSYFTGNGTSSIPTGNSSYTMLVWARQRVADGWGFANGFISIGGYFTINQSNALRTLNATTGHFHHYWWFTDLSLENNSAGLSLGTWFLVAATFDGTTRRIWVNGVSRASDTPTGHNVTSTTIQVSKTVSTEYQIGDMAIARIYNRALTSSEMTLTYNAEKARFGL